MLRDNANSATPSPVPDGACRDPKDLYLIGLAHSIQAEFLVTGDKHLLDCVQYGATLIVTPRGFWDNPTKSKVAKLDQCRFLGFSFRGKKIVWSEKSLAQFKRRVRELTGRTVGHERRMAGITRLGLGANPLDRFSLPGSESVRDT